MIELRYPEVQEYFEQIGMPVEESNFYLVEDAPSRSSINLNIGTYLPRNKNGYIQPEGNLSEIEEAYIHEYAHGSFFENTELGQIIVDKDQKLSKKERLLFGNLEDEEFKAVPDSSLETSIKVSESPKTYRVNPKELDKYRRIRKEMKKALSATKTLIEGFSLLIEDEIGEADTKLARPGESYVHLKRIRDSEGMQGVEEFLSSPREVQNFLYKEQGI